MMSESLERLRDRMQITTSVRGEPSRIREQLQENSQVQAELEKLGVALENITKQGSELASSLPDDAKESQGICLLDMWFSTTSPWPPLFRASIQPQIP